MTKKYYYHPVEEKQVWERQEYLISIALLLLQDIENEYKQYNPTTQQDCLRKEYTKEILDNNFNMSSKCGLVVKFMNHDESIFLHEKGGYAAMWPTYLFDGKNCLLQIVDPNVVPNISGLNNDVLKSNIFHELIHFIDFKDEAPTTGYFNPNDSNKESVKSIFEIYQKREGDNVFPVPQDMKDYSYYENFYNLYGFDTEHYAYLNYIYFKQESDAMEYIRDWGKQIDSLEECSIDDKQNKLWNLMYLEVLNRNNLVYDLPRFLNHSKCVIDKVNHSISKVTKEEYEKFKQNFLSYLKLALKMYIKRYAENFKKEAFMQKYIF